MKIVNMRKFLKIILLIIGIIFAILFYSSNISFSKSEIKTKVIYVANGDTLWDIATQEKENNVYYKNKDIRDIIYQIKKINNIEKNSTLTIGQKLIINYI